MSRAASGAVVRQIESLFDGGSVAGLTDRQLLERFNTRRDSVGEAAFAALVTRHGPMVLDVCRQIVGDQHLAEDAFQAVFLVLASKARSIGNPDLLSNWLYGVALRTARKAKARLARQRKHEEGSMRPPGSGSSTVVDSSVQPALDREDVQALHDEIARLPGSFRLPVVLCYFEGLTLDEAARRLRCPAGTLRSRLARARDKLRRNLTRRGFAVPAAVLATALGTRSASASVSSPLCDATTKAAIQFAAGTAASPLAASLAREVLRAMLIHRLRFTIIAVLALAAFATSAGFLTHSLAMKDEPKKAPAASQPPLAANPNGPAPGRMFVVGRVLDPQGKPVPGATVMVHTRVRQSGDAFGSGIEGMGPAVIGHADADGSGRFRLDAPRTSSSRNNEFLAVALAPGYGIGWAELDPDADQPDAEIRLNPEQVIQGRLFDLQGRPAQGITVSVWRILRVPIRVSGYADMLGHRFEGPFYWWARPNDLPAWPKPATTDADGRFTVHGVGRGFQTTLTLIDPQFATQMIDVETDNSTDTKTVTMALRPAQIITGRVIYADTGKPVPHAPLGVRSWGEGQRGGWPTNFQTDADGRFRVNPAPGDQFDVQAYAPAGQPYLGTNNKRFEWPKGAIEHSLDLSLPRGVLIRGKVTEQGSNQPLPGALVVSVSQPVGNDSNVISGRARTLADGSFELAGAPRPSQLAIQIAGEDYVLQGIGNREFFAGQQGGMRLYSHAFIAYNPKPGSASLEVNVSLRRGVTVTGRIVAPDDQPVADTWIISRIALEPSPMAWSMWRGNYHGNARNGRFELHGLDPNSDVPVHFFEPKRKLGATVHLPGKSAAGGQITVRLQPCGMAKARLVDSNGQPVAGYKAQFFIAMIVTPGVLFRGSPDIADPRGLLAEEDFLARIDSINYLNGPTSDAQGKIVFPALIPGASYRVSDPARARRTNQPPFRKDFTVKPGETLDLGDVVIEKPPN
jgi:RNA polymerase sigma factor (sigma-70 family)